MKHQICEQDHVVLAALLLELGLVFNQATEGTLLETLASVLHANETINLTRITDWDDAMRLHLVDSLAAMPEVSAAVEGPMLDLGSGGGFPGAPLAIATARRATLLDSVAKKGAAVRQALLDAGQSDDSIDVASARAEEYALGHRDEYAVVVARAVASLPALVELASPLLASGGRLVALKGCPEPTERDSGAKAARLVGMREIGWRELRLPGGGEARTIVTYERQGASPMRLPRRTGLAQHSPLA